MYAETKLTLNAKKNALTVPLEAVSRIGNVATVLARDANNAIEERHVTLGMEDSTNVEVLTGINEGERIVIGNRSQFRAGDRVQPTAVEVISGVAEERSNVRLLDRNTHFSSWLLPDYRDRRNSDAGANAGGLFPPINIPVVVVATFYSGMPPAGRNEITNPFERFFTWRAESTTSNRVAAGREPDQNLFSAGDEADADLSTISNLAMADLRRLPPGTLPPVVLKFDASSLPVCLITLKGEGLNETQLQDLGHTAFEIKSRTCRELRYRNPSGALPANHGVRRSAEIAGSPVESDGRGAGTE